MRPRRISRIFKYEQKLYCLLLGVTLLAGLPFLLQGHFSTVTSNSMNIPSLNTGAVPGRRIKFTQTPQLQPPGKWFLTEGMHEAWIRAVKEKHELQKTVSRNPIYMNHESIAQKIDTEDNNMAKTNQQGIDHTALQTHDAQTSIVQPTRCNKCFKNNYELLISNNNLCGKPQVRDILLVAFIATAIKDVDRRQAIRETWARSSRNNTASTLRYFFILGLNTEMFIPGSVVKESQVYNDIVVYGFIDTYDNLTTKTMMGLSHIRKFCKSAQFVLKTDADVYVNFPSVFRLLRSYLIQTEHSQAQIFDLDYERSLYSIKELNNLDGDNLDSNARKTLLKRVLVNNTVTIPGKVLKIGKRTATNGIFGLLWHEASPIRNASTGLKKWVVTHEDYPKSVYPDYLDGMGYILPMYIVKRVISAAEKTKVFHFEDVFVGLCLEHLGIHLENTNGFLRLDSEVTVCSHKSNKVFLVHRVSPMLMRNIWRTKCTNNGLVQIARHLRLEANNVVTRNLTFDQN